MNASIVKERDKLPGLTEENWEGCAGRLIGWEEEMKKGVKVWYVFEDEGGTRAGHLLPTRNRGLFESRSYGGGQIREL